MVIKETIYEQCECCNRRGKIIADAVYGCDECKTEFQTGDTLRMTIHNEGEDGDYHQFCSWKCVIKFLPKAECDNFISLPFLSFDNESGKEFLKLIKTIKL